MSIKMIVTDLDGTLLHRDSAISDYTISVLRKCSAKGIKIAYATARDARDTIPALSQLVDGFVYSNGAKAYVGDTLVNSRTIPMNDVRDFLIAAGNAGVKICVESNGIHYANFDITKYWVGWIPSYENADFNTLDIEIEKILAVADTLDESKYVELFINKNLPDHLCFLVREEGLLMVIMHKEAIKSKGIAALAGHWGIKQTEIVAFGDDIIDIDLLEYCGIGVAVSNALNDVKAVADDICESNDNDGVAKWLEERIL
jgi:Cof subfamily protein (haloacid dehalogenase superfamily)